MGQQQHILVCVRVCGSVNSCYKSALRSLVFQLPNLVVERPLIRAESEYGVQRTSFIIIVPEGTLYKAFLALGK